jgi:hypothetical protein
VGWGGVGWGGVGWGGVGWGGVGWGGVGWGGVRGQEWVASEHAPPQPELTHKSSHPKLGAGGVDVVVLEYWVKTVGLYVCLINHVQAIEVAELIPAAFEVTCVRLDGMQACMMPCCAWHAAMEGGEGSTSSARAFTNAWTSTRAAAPRTRGDGWGSASIALH